MSAARCVYARKRKARCVLDYYHTGGQGQELFAVDRVVSEPLPWPGRPEGNLDPIDSGLYRFEVRDAGDRVLYSRGYSSIYAEWALTAEAQTGTPDLPRVAAIPGAVRARQGRRAEAPARPVVRHASGRSPVDPADMFVRRAPRTGPQPIALETARRAARQGRPAAARRRLHRRGMCRQVPARRATAARRIVPSRPVRLATRCIQRVGTVSAGQRIRDLAAVDRRAARHAGAAPPTTRSAPSATY